MYICSSKSCYFMKRSIFSVLISVLVIAGAGGHTVVRLELPNREQLSSERVLCVIQDSEGCLWYATEGGGICRDDGRMLTVMRNDATHPNLLGSNNVCCLAEAGDKMVIGTYHGAYLLDKADFSIKQMEAVDSKRVDDILVTRQGEVLLTANKKIFRFDKSLQLLDIYPSQWKGVDAYVARLYEDGSGRIWATQWNGGLVRMQGDGFVEADWTIGAQPTDLADADDGDLWVGTVGRGIVRYRPEDGTIVEQPKTGSAVCIDLQLSKDGQRLWMITMNALSAFQTGEELTPMPLTEAITDSQMVLHRLSLDLHGNLLVAGSEPGPFVVADDEKRSWYEGVVTDDGVSWTFQERQGVMMTDASGERTVGTGSRQLLPVMAKRKGGGIWATDGVRLFACTPDSIAEVATLTERPAALAEDGNGDIWYSTGKTIRKWSVSSGTEDSMIEQADVSALAFTPDGRLWLATIFGRLYSYTSETLMVDEYGSNEHGDAVTYLSADSLGRLLMVSDRYVRIYDPQRHTMRQQSREAEDTYCIELEETDPESRWTCPQEDTIVERLPRWLTSWWMCCIYVLLVVLVILLLVHDIVLRRQRKRFLEQIDFLQTRTSTTEEEPQTADKAIVQEDSFLNDAIAMVEAHLGDDKYSVEQLSSELCMSRMTFYRKIQSATGQKPTEFIRTIRLRRAAALLRKGQMTISEICFATGFASVSYFSRCFRTLYGVSPTQFMEHPEATTVVKAPPSDELPA